MFLSTLTSSLKNLGFYYNSPMLRGFLFTRPDNVAVAVDHGICDNSRPFPYSEYTEEQNDLMHRHQAFYRWVADTEDDIEPLCDMLLNLLEHKYEEEDSAPAPAVDRQVASIDPTAPEAYFEQAFIDVYGRENIDRVTREYPVVDIAGRPRFVDYYIEKRDGNIAIEKNGELYHHPLVVGKERYLDQLLKQNSLVAYGCRVYRWSLQSMQFKERFQEELKLYLGEADRFLLSQKVSVTRGFSLYQHQENALESMIQGRAQGQKASLVVLPTGTGKTEILIGDFAAMYKQAENSFTGLVMVPTRHLKDQTIEAFNTRLPEYGIAETNLAGDQPGSKLLVQTYAWMIRHIFDYDSKQFDYIAIDEAHHAMAPALRKVIHRFDPGFMLGLTATDRRLDAAKLEDVFGSYEVDLSLVDAIKQGLLAPIRAFRLKSNIDLSQIRFNGRDFVNADLERGVVVPSRNQLIVDLLKKYFVDSSLERKSGIIFCVSIKHCKQLAKALQEQGISAESVHGQDADSQKKIARYQRGEIQFLTSCSLLNEGWDSPRTSVIVMARPTMSKVLYTQQLGRGTRKYPGKEALYVIDVVDNYGSLGTLKNIPWSIHALLGCQRYMAWADVLDCDRSPGKEEVILAGLYEEERAIEEIDIFTFEYKYPDHLSDEQLARELFVSTGTVKSWVKGKKITPAVTIPFGRSVLNYYALSQVGEIRDEMGLKVHDETTQYDDFFEFLEERGYTMSYKMILLLSMFRIMDINGECSLDDLAVEYSKFYRNRLEKNLTVDRSACPYNPDNIDDGLFIKNSILVNPFEKFERKRFMYQCKDLNRIAFSVSLWSKLQKPADINRIKRQMLEDLVGYYENLGGIPDIDHWREYWNVPEAVTDEKKKPIFELITTPPENLKYVEYVPYFDYAAVAGAFGQEQDISSGCEGWLHLPEERIQKDMFAVRIEGQSMAPKIPDKSVALFRAGSALGGTREGRIVLVQHDGSADPETGYSFTVKQYHSRKQYKEDGSFTHEQIELKPLNPGFSPIIINNAEPETFRVLGEFLRILEV